MERDAGVGIPFSRSMRSATNLASATSLQRRQQVEKQDEAEHRPDSGARNASRTAKAPLADAQSCCVRTDRSAISSQRSISRFRSLLSRTPSGAMTLLHPPKIAGTGPMRGAASPDAAGSAREATTRRPAVGARIGNAPDQLLVERRVRARATSDAWKMTPRAPASHLATCVERS